MLRKLGGLLLMSTVPLCAGLAERFLEGGVGRMRDHLELRLPKRVSCCVASLDGGRDGGVCRALFVFEAGKAGVASVDGLRERLVGLEEKVIRFFEKRTTSSSNSSRRSGRNDIRRVMWRVIRPGWLWMPVRLSEAGRGRVEALV